MTPAPIVFLFDVDNTLLDNDRVAADLHALPGARGRRRAPASATGRSSRSCARELGYADYLGALQRYRVEHPRDPHLLAVSPFLVDYPFANRLYPELARRDRAPHAAGARRSSCPTATWSSSRARSSARALRGGRGPRPDLHPQGAGARRRRAALSGRALRAGRRQAAHPDRGQESLGRARDDGLSAPGPLRPPARDVAPPRPRPHGRAHRRPARPRPARAARGGSPGFVVGHLRAALSDRPWPPRRRTRAPSPRPPIVSGLVRRRELAKRPGEPVWPIEPGCELTNGRHVEPG